MQRAKFKQSEIGKIPENWEMKKLSDFCDILMGQSPPSSAYNVNENGLPFFQGRKDFGMKFPVKAMWCTEPTRIANAGDVLLSVRAPVGDVNVAIEECCIGRGLSALSMKNGDKIFLYYLLLHNQQRLKQIFESEGTVFGCVTKDGLRDFKVALPVKEAEQRAIAKILSDLDEKIELNRQMNKTLESIAQAIFKRWFVDFEFPNEKGKPYKSSGGEMVDSGLGEIPKGWRAAAFSDLVDNIKESLKPGTHLRDRKYVPINCLAMRNIGIEVYKDFSEAKSSLIAFEKGDILFGAMRAYFHRVNLAPFAGITRTTTFVLRPKKKQYLSYSLFLLNQDSSVEYANAHSKGTTMPYAVWEGSLAEMPIVLPDERTIESFYLATSPTLEKMNSLIFENQNLHKIRDSLLPRLMSGKARVKEV